MHDYASLPTLVPVMDRILGYLSVKERIKAKSVCRAWKVEIELRERKNDTLILHIGPYRWNIRWAETNNRRLMKFENSFEVKRLTFLDHPRTRSLLKKTKKLAIVLYYNIFDPTASAIQPYLDYIEHCEELELRAVPSNGTLTFNLPKLKVLVLSDSMIEKLVIDCPSLEVLFWNEQVHEIRFKNVKKLKRLICYGWPVIVSVKGKGFSTLESLNLFVARDEPVSDRLLDRMPKLKRLVIYSNNLQADLEIIREQQKRYGLKNLEVIFNGFRCPVEMAIDLTSFRLMIKDGNIDLLHANYSNLAEDSPWRVCIDYSKLFSKFKILPSNFFERFREPFEIKISAVTNYTHLLGFLKFYPYLQKLIIHSKVDVNRVLGLVHSLQPSLTVLTIVEEHPLDVLKIDLSSLRLLNLIQLDLESTRLPPEFFRRAAVNRSSHLNSIRFTQASVRRPATGLLMVYFHAQGPILIVNNRPLQYSNIEQLITGMRNEPDLKNILI